MTDDFGVDLDQVYKVTGAAEVLVVRFHIIQKRLLIDFRTRPGLAPLISIVPPAESVEDRFRSIRRLRPELPIPEKVMSFNWPRSMPILVTSGVWQHIVDRMATLGGHEAMEDCGRAMDALLAEEHLEVMGAIRGASHYQTLWERQHA